MQYYLFCFLTTLVGINICVAQLYQGSGHVRFYSSAPVEDIKATNDNLKSLFKLESMEIVFTVSVKQFEFEKSLMQEHFNENYMESGKYPNATFKGIVLAFDQEKSGKQSVSAQGQLEIHGVSKEVTITGELEQMVNKIVLDCQFLVALIDYDIDRPQILWQNIAENIEVTLYAEYSIK